MKAYWKNAPLMGCSQSGRQQHSMHTPLVVNNILTLHGKEISFKWRTEPTTKMNEFIYQNSPANEGVLPLFFRQKPKLPQKMYTDQQSRLHLIFAWKCSHDQRANFDSPACYIVEPLYCHCNGLCKKPYGTHFYSQAAFFEKFDCELLWRWWKR